MRVLIVDDSRAMRAILSRIATAAGFDVIHQAGNGQEALEQLQQNGTVDVLIVDWNMPVMNGLELVQALRSNPLHGDVKVLMSTTETEKERMDQALQAGADDYIMKPFSTDALLDRLDAMGIGAPRP